MPSFHDSATSSAAPEEIWKLLYDPTRFPEWWAGVETVEVQDDDSYTMYPDGYPDFPMGQRLDTHYEAQRVTISCLVSDLRFDWRLQPDGDGTLVTVDVEIPASEADRLNSQREIIRRSLHRLAQLGSTG